MEMLCVTPDAFAYFIGLLDASVIKSHLNGLMIGTAEQTFWYFTGESWCAPDVPRLRGH